MKIIIRGKIFNTKMVHASLIASHRVIFRYLIIGWDWNDWERVSPRGGRDVGRESRRCRRRDAITHAAWFPLTPPSVLRP
jgi:hypothetical protein